MIPDTKLGDNVANINEVFNDKTTTTNILSEFKMEAASLILDQEYPLPEAARSIVVGETALRRWVEQLKLESVA